MGLEDWWRLYLQKDYGECVGLDLWFEIEECENGEVLELINKAKYKTKKIYFFGFEPMKMHCKCTYQTNAFLLRFC